MQWDSLILQMVLLGECITEGDATEGGLAKMLRAPANDPQRPRAKDAPNDTAEKLN